MFYCTKCQRVSEDGIVWTVEKEIKKNKVHIGTLCEFCEIKVELTFLNLKYWLRRF